jgi:GMP synthase (glutamine-hydrolysing)
MNPPKDFSAIIPSGSDPVAPFSQSVVIVQNDPEVPPGNLVPLLRREKVPFSVVRPYAGETLPQPAACGRIVVLGGAMGTGDTAEHPFLVQVKGFVSEAVRAGTPFLGICLGGQILAEALWGKVTSRFRGEKGIHDVELMPAGELDPLFRGIPSRFSVFQWHDDSFDIPFGSVHLAGSVACPGQAFRYGNAWGIQFHPEVDIDIVSAWSAYEPGGAAYPAAFAAAEAACGETAETLFTNFLRISP